MKTHVHHIKNDLIKGAFLAALNECRANGGPVYLKTEEEDEFVMLRADIYQEYIDSMEQLDISGEIMEGIKDAEKGRLIPAEVVLAELRKKF